MTKLLHPSTLLRLLLLAVGGSSSLTLLAQAQEVSPAPSGWKLHPHPIAMDLRHQEKTLLALGLLNQQQRLGGLSIAGLLNHNQQGGTGLQIAGVANLSASGRLAGVSLAPLINAHRGVYHGLQLAFLNRTHDGRGILQIGALNGTRHLQGMQLGAINTTDQLAGLQLATFANLISLQGSGLQVAPVNIAGQGRGLVQLGLINATAGRQVGVQLGIYNFAGEIASPQIGLLNVTGATDHGLQIGLINITRQQHTRQIGLANIGPRTHIQLLLGGGSLTKGHFAVRFRRDRGYSLVGVGLGYRSLRGDFSGSFSYRRGLIFPLGQKLALLGDLGFAHIEDTPLKHLGDANRRYAFEARTSLEYPFSRLIGAYLTGGYSFSSRYHRPYSHSHRPIIEAGITLF